MHSFKVLHLLRSPGATSMPWNDLYNTQRRIAPGTAYPPVRITLQIKPIRKASEDCLGVNRKYFSVNPFGFLFLLYRISKHRRTDKPILHIHNPGYFWAAALVVALRMKFRIFSNLHNEWSRYPRRHRFGMWALSRLSEKLICVSEAISKTIPRKSQLKLRSRGALYSVPNGIHRRHLDAEFPISKFPEQRAPNVVVVARIVPQKNPEFVLSVFSKSSSADKLIWFGKGVLLDRMKARAEELGIAERVDWRGQRPRAEVLNELRKSAVYMSCSLWEGIGVANIEAAAMGARILLSDIPPHVEITKSLGLSTLALGEFDPWVKAIDSACEFETSQGSDSKNRAKQSREAFDLDSLIAEYIELYKNPEGVA